MATQASHPQRLQQLYRETQSRSLPQLDLSLLAGLVFGAFLLGRLCGVVLGPEVLDDLLDRVVLLENTIASR
ncbi:MAG: hypothetical protein ABEI27_12215 [Halobellus sp.]|uniref:hypothetical protein n=1 Tax=Halobellus sp. TaxID=1979212 RepID=UPI0035D430B6